MNYNLANTLRENFTYGMLVAQVAPIGPAQTAGLRGGCSQVQIAGQTYTAGGDIIIAINGNAIVNGDDLSSYLGEKTLPGDRIVLSVVRNNAEMSLTAVLGTRPSPSSQLCQKKMLSAIIN